MLIKYFSSGASSSGAVEYIEKNETAKTLKGNNNLTRDLIKNNTNKLKYRSGVISFGSDRPSKKDVMEIIELFEKSTFAGLDKDQYNSLWVEHNDKENYHIHFVLPRLELSTMKAFNPHYHKADQKRLMKLQDYINSKYHLINPFEADRRQTNLSADIRDNMKDKEIKEMIYKHIDTAFTDGIIENRNDVIKVLQDSNFIVKKSKNFLGIKKTNGKHIRLKGVYYNENFTSRAELAEELAETERKHRADTHGELVKAREALDRLIQFKANKISKQYPKKCKKITMDVISSTDIQSNTSRLYADTKQDNHLERQRTGVDTKSNDKQRKERGIHIHKDHRHTEQRRPDPHIHQSGIEEIRNKEGVIVDYNIHDKNIIKELKKMGFKDDSTRTTITRSIKSSRTETQKLNEELKRARERIHEQYINDSRELQRSNERTAERTHSAIEQYHERAKVAQSENEREVENNIISKFNFEFSIGELTRRFKKFGTKVIDKIKETLRSSREEREATPRRKRSSRSFGMSM